MRRRIISRPGLRPVGVALGCAALCLGGVFPWAVGAGTTAGAITTGPLLAVVAGGGLTPLGSGSEPATSPELESPLGVAVDSKGNLYIADADLAEVFEVSAGRMSLLAGGGTNSVTTTPQAPTSVSFDPIGVAVDPSGNVYITALDNAPGSGAGQVYKISATTHEITLVAGGGSAVPTTSQQPGTDVVLQAPTGVVTNSSGDVFVSDSDAIQTGPGSSSGEVDELTPSGQLSVVAGGGPATNNVTTTPQPATAVNLSVPGGLAVDSVGNLYLADTYNDVVDEVSKSTGDIAVIAGGGSSTPSPTPEPATSAVLPVVLGLAAGPNGAVYLTGPGSGGVYEVAGGSITEVAGGGSTPPSTSPIAALDANPYEVYGVASDASGDLFVTGEYETSVSKQVVFEIGKPPSISSLSRSSLPPAGGTVTITGKNLADATAVHFGSKPASQFACSVTSCTAVAPAGVVGSSPVTVTTPLGTSSGSPFIYRASTTTTLSLSSSKAIYGQENKDVLSVRVTPSGTAATPTGKVTIAGTSCSITLVGGKGTCLLSDRAFSVETVHLRATYSGSSDFAASTSGLSTLTVEKAPTTTRLTPSARQLTYGQESSERLTIAVSALGGTPTGSVSLSGLSCSKTLQAGRASCTLSAKALKVGSDKLKATYKGSADFASSVSTEVTIEVKSPAHHHKVAKKRR